MTKNVLITGITGMLGQSIYRKFLNHGGFKLFGVSRQSDFSLLDVKMFYGDLCSIDFVKTLSEVSFCYIIHCSAEVNVNYCEINRESAIKSNVTATCNVFSLLSAEKYVYISTDSVFDGIKGNYNELSEVNPLNFYAETKLLGEESVKQNTEKYYILRTNIYGFNKPMKNSLFEWAYSELNKNKQIYGFTNMFFNPLYVGQLAQLLIELFESKVVEFGTYNLATTDKISKYDFLVKIAEEFNFGLENITPLNFNQNDLVAPRALNTVLDNSKIKSLFNNFDFSFNTGFSMLKKDLKNE